MEVTHLASVVGDGAGSDRDTTSSDDDDGNDDQLSRLPDPVLLDILSLLPTRDLVKTVLVPRFRSLWPYVRHIDFDYYISEIGDRLGNLIRSVLMVHQLPTIHGFKICFPFHTPYEFLPPHVHLLLSNNTRREGFARHLKIMKEVDVCVGFAVRKQVRVFELDLGYRCSLMCEPDTHYTLSAALFRLASLTELRLGCCHINPGGKVSLHSLRILSLKRVALTENIMQEILLGCPLLENLSLLEWFGLINKLSIMNPKTKSLTLHHQSLQARLQIFCPHVLALKIHLLGQIEDLDLINVSSVEDADLRLENTTTSDDDMSHVVIMLPEKLRRARAIKLCHFTAKGLIDSGLTTMPSLLLNWRLLRLNLMDWHPSGLCKLLQRCPHLETLTLRVGSDFLDASCWKWSHDDGCWKWSHDLAVEIPIPCHAADVSFHCLKHSLKTISVVIFSNLPAVFEFLKLLLNKSAVLEKMVLSLSMQACRSIGRHTLMELIQQFSSLNKASPRAVIRISPAY